MSPDTLPNRSVEAVRVPSLSVGRVPPCAFLSEPALRYQLAFAYFINQQGGFVNLLLISVCQFIPALGPIVLMGYLAEVSVALNNDPDIQQHPQFTFARFEEYLSRGVWPFLINLILAIPTTMILIGAAVGGLVINPPGPGNPPLVAFVLFGIAFLVTMVIYSALCVPMCFHAEMIGKFDLAGAFRFAAEFWSQLFGLAILTGIVFFILAWLVSFLGLLCCFVGIYPASALAQMAGQHLMVQLYREYLNRGGEPLVEYKPDEWDDDYEGDPPDS